MQIAYVVAGFIALLVSACKYLSCVRHEGTTKTPLPTDGILFTTHGYHRHQAPEAQLSAVYVRLADVHAASDRHQKLRQHSATRIHQLSQLLVHRRTDHDLVRYCL